MGLFDRLAKRVADEITKAPAGAVPITEMQMRGGIYQSQYGYGSTTPLPRDTELGSIPFAPGIPLIPGAINPVRPDGRPNPRRYEYLVAQNINVSENRNVPFKTLRAAADQIDILRRCIEVLKAKLIGLDWDITLSQAASERVVAEQGGNHLRAMAEAREQFSDEIARLQAFWSNPDPQNGLTFADWLSMSLEEILVLDAWAIWPQLTVGGDIRGLQILDGSTIKPLLDDRGMRPDPSVGPAFQQILYGFPRSEFLATQDDEAADGEFTTDELAYFVKNRRTNSVYGYSPVERALPMADIYLRRQQWLRAEYTDGVLPELMFETDANFGNNPELLRAYENIFNDDLAGQTEQRKRARLLPAGLKAIQFDSYGEKFSQVMDEYLITSICGHFGVLPTEIGFSQRGGLGSSGHQQGEAESANQIGVVPLATWVSDTLSNISYRWLGMPRELEFKLMPSDRENNSDTAKRDDTRLRNGSETVNEARAELGLPLLDTPEADMPILVAGQSVFLFSPEGIISAGTPVDDNGEQVDQPETPEKPEEKPKEKSAHAEMRSFIRWTRKGYSNRTFNFEAVEPTYAEVLNKFVAEKDFDAARWYAERYLGV